MHNPWELRVFMFMVIAIIAVAAWKGAERSAIAVNKTPPKEVVEISEFIQGRNKCLGPELAEVISLHAFEHARKKGLPVGLVIGIVEKESKFNPFEISSEGAKGLMQVMIINADKAHGVEYNIDKGTDVLVDKLRITGGDLNAALVLYSGGAGGYVEGVLANVGRYELYHRSKKGAKDDQ